MQYYCALVTDILMQKVLFHMVNMSAFSDLSCSTSVFSFLHNQPDAPIIPILFCYKSLHVSGIFSAHHQEFSTVHSARVSFMQVLMTASKQSQDGIDLLCPSSGVFYCAFGRFLTTASKQSQDGTAVSS